MDFLCTEPCLKVRSRHDDTVIYDQTHLFSYFLSIYTIQVLRTGPTWRRNRFQSAIFNDEGEIKLIVFTRTWQKKTSLC